ncbi:cell division topological specificity factor MinE [Allorhizobium sp. BGMRC 0089]|uniref:cell division topological specificity factor MinE n=1 Tax=Allorhizobium sonneratiae TaxID=2934936 RepID=UPI002034418A|nr:cell division topological specificity factor MinE [Allorhizobium sonneratiae]MCM2291006.1 cell division topological specificity factor MinE [Allorhizobium sonneratiae]
MSIFDLFRKQQSAPTARERLQVLLAHERATLDNDLVIVLREEILAVLARHVEIDSDKVRITVDRDDRVSILEIDVEIPRDNELKAA